MTHAEFIAAYAAGDLKVNIDPPAAARYVSARLLLPFVMMPVIGIGVALALVGWLVTGFIVIGLGMIVPRLIKRSAPHFVLMQSLQDEKIYNEVVTAGIMQVSNAA